MISGSPIPPFRIKAPSGAPMKNKMIQENPKTNLSCIEIICLFIFTSESKSDFDLILRSSLADFTEFRAKSSN